MEACPPSFDGKFSISVVDGFPIVFSGFVYLGSSTRVNIGDFQVLLNRLAEQ